MIRVMMILLFAACTLFPANSANARNEFGVRAGGLGDFYVGAEWQTPTRVGPATFAPSVDLAFGDLDAMALNGDLRWELLPVPDTSIGIYGKAGPTLMVADQNNKVGLSLTIAADIGMRKGRSLQVELRFGLGDLPDTKMGAAVMFPF